MERSELRELLSGSRVVRQEGDGKEDEFSVYAETVRPEGELAHTRQSEAESADINKIVQRFERSGILPMVKREGVYLDVSEVGDYRSALEQVRAADEYFMTLPAESRAMFNHDPAEFLDKVNSGELEVLVKAGVIPKDEVKPVAPPESAATPPG